MKSYVAIVKTPGHPAGRMIIQARDYTKAYLKITYILPFKSIIVNLEELK